MEPAVQVISSVTVSVYDPVSGPVIVPPENVRPATVTFVSRMTVPLLISAVSPVPGSVSPDQFSAVLQLSSLPPPSKVTVVGTKRPSSGSSCSCTLLPPRRFFEFVAFCFRDLRSPNHGTISDMGSPTLGKHISAIMPPTCDH